MKFCTVRIYKDITTILILNKPYLQSKLIVVIKSLQIYKKYIFIFTFLSLKDTKYDLLIGLIFHFDKAYRYLSSCMHSMLVISLWLLLCLKTRRSRSHFRHFLPPLTQIQKWKSTPKEVCPQTLFKWRGRTLVVGGIFSMGQFCLVNRIHLASFVFSNELDAMYENMKKRWMSKIWHLQWYCRDLWNK